MHGHVGDRAEGTQEGLLPKRLLWIVRPSVDVGREVADAVDLIAWRREGCLTESRKVQPLMGSALQATIVEVEAVDIDVRSHPDPK